MSEGHGSSPLKPFLIILIFKVPAFLVKYVLRDVTRPRAIADHATTCHSGSGQLYRDSSACAISNVGLVVCNSHLWQRFAYSSKSVTVIRE